MTTNDREAPGITRLIDFKIPLHWLLVTMAGLAWALISMWFSLNQLVGLVSDLQVDVKSGNGSTNVISSELALIKFRTSSNETEILLLKKKLEIKP
jgi:hypothetical protein